MGKEKGRERGQESGKRTKRRFENETIKKKMLIRRGKGKKERERGGESEMTKTRETFVLREMHG